MIVRISNIDEYISVMPTESLTIDILNNGRYPLGNSEGVLSLELSESGLFDDSIYQQITSYTTDDGEVINNNIIDRNTRKISFDFITNFKTYYVRPVITFGDKSFTGTSVLISTQTNLTLQTVPMEKDYRPDFISFLDFYEIYKEDDSLEFRVTVTNNANDEGDTVWEDVTKEYLSNSNYRFKNKKNNNGWAVSVKIVAIKRKKEGTYKLHNMRYIIT